ncbi:NAD(P)-dependent oxidoreductase [Candidatus Wolfebacteria bacterium]|nr:NAD(P)-dependent oxidoreductase [Candidatus Wolfebacteria bacterium]
MGPILITGAHGKLGCEIAKIFPEALTPTHRELDIRLKNNISDFIERYKPEMVIHLAADTDVRRCESHQKDAYEVNVKGTENLVFACEKFIPDSLFVYMSTACVFRGDKGDYSEEDIPYPENFYALTKLLGEFIVKRAKKFLIIRGNFVAREKWPYPKAFTDRFGTYLFADDLALAIRDIIEKDLAGIVHAVGEEKISMFDLAKITTPDVLPITMNEIDMPLTKDMSLRSVRIAPYKITRA